MNLRDRDIVNWPVVQMADAAVILVADIDRGGVFAQVIGTMDLLAQEERQRVIGVIINKFRGDLTLFEDGVKIIEERTGVPVLGVLPYLRGLELDQEDSVDIERFRMTPFGAETVNVAVVLLPHMSNFTDFNQLAAESDVALRYVASPKELHGADVMILPGSKTTIQVRARALRGTWDDDCLVEGYEIHMGVTVRSQGILPCFEIISHPKTVPSPPRALSSKDHPQRVRAFQCLDGAKSADGMVWGTYIHGVFDQPGFRREWLNRARIRKTLPPLDVEVSRRVSARLTQALDRWADHVGTYINTKHIFSAIEP